jgi:BolA protein
MTDFSVSEKIENLLKQNLKLKTLEVINNSHLHTGHIEAGDAQNTHFKIIAKRDEVIGNSLIDKHRSINDSLSDLMNNPIHALEIKLV